MILTIGWISFPLWLEWREQVSLNIKESLVVEEAAVGDTDYKVQCIVLREESQKKCKSVVFDQTGWPLPPNA